MGKEKHGGQSKHVPTLLYLNPAATMAASVIQVPPSGPGNSCEPGSNFQFRIFSNIFFPPRDREHVDNGPLKEASQRSCGATTLRLRLDFIRCQRSGLRLGWMKFWSCCSALVRGRSALELFFRFTSEGGEEAT